MDKTKLVILKLDKLYLVVPFTMTKIEVRVRNLIINQRQKMESIGKFIEFYLEQYETQDKIEKQELKAHEKMLIQQAKEKKDKPEAQDASADQSESKKAAASSSGVNQKKKSSLASKSKNQVSVAPTDQIR